MDIQKIQYLNADGSFARDAYVQTQKVEVDPTQFDTEIASLTEDVIPQLQKKLDDANARLTSLQAKKDALISLPVAQTITLDPVQVETAQPMQA